MDLLRFTTAGSVDDGKSTLIGRLLYDSKSIFQDQMEALETSSRLRGEEQVNLALLTDGLRAEREQGITIDVAYRYFSTPQRKFIIADTPGHEQYTRNMVTGASTADLAIIIIDARNGISTQSKRHGFIASLLGIKHIVVAVNKMDLVGYSEDIYNDIVKNYTEFSRKLNFGDMKFIPLSALLGDNVVNNSDKMPWYKGSTLLYHLENTPIASDLNLVDFRLPVQTVIRPNQDFRGYAGMIESGTLRVGESIISLPSGQKSRIQSIMIGDCVIEEASAGQSVVVTLEDERDISRGDMIVREKNIPRVSSEVDAIICWMDHEKNLNTKNKYVLRHTTNQVDAFVTSVEYLIDVNTLHRLHAGSVDLNSIARVSIVTASPIFCDAYQKNKATGSFVLIDQNTNLTVAAGMIRDATPKTFVRKVLKTSTDVTLEPGQVSRAVRESKNQHRAMVVWLTGYSGSGKTTIASAVEAELFVQDFSVVRIDGDNLRHGLCGDLGFGANDRKENIRRAAHVCELLFKAGNIVLASFISPFEEDRAYARSVIENNMFFEVFVDCSLEECIKRDKKGLYAKAINGEISDFTGISSPYFAPQSPDLILRTESIPTNETVKELVEFIKIKSSLGKF
jgi:bifunctional enzyme CysN/CysC